MKIKKFYGFIALTVVLLTTSLTFFGSSRKIDMSDLNSSNVEALSSGESRFVITDKCIIDTQLNTMVLFNGVNVVEDGEPINTCNENGGGCLLNLEAMTQSSASQTRSWLQDIGAAASAISTFVSVVAEICKIFI